MALAHTLSPTCSLDHRLTSSQPFHRRLQNLQNKSADSYPRLLFRGGPGAGPSNNRSEPDSFRVRVQAVGRGQKGMEVAREVSREMLLWRRLSAIPYVVRMSGDFLPKLCVVTGTRPSVWKL